MTRKSKKGIVGKAMPTLTKRSDEVGVGISFPDKGLNDSVEIEQAVERAKNNQ